MHSNADVINVSAVTFCCTQVTRLKYKIGIIAIHRIGVGRVQLRSSILVVFFSLFSAFTPSHAQDYLIQQGDELVIAVWRENDLSRKQIVRPDGKISFPLIGDVSVLGKSVEILREEITSKLAKYIEDANVEVSVTKTSNLFYVVGNVQKPGIFGFYQGIDVMQALALAGGTTPFASLNKIKILRRTEDGPTYIEFSYSEVENGKNLQQNIILKSGDTVVVP